MEVVIRDYLVSKREIVRETVDGLNKTKKINYLFLLLFLFYFL